MEFDLGPLPLLLLVLIAGATLLTWHRHGGPVWAFAAGGFLYILGRIGFVAICGVMAYAMLGIASFADGAILVRGAPVLMVLAIALWWIVAVADAVYSDAFGAAREPEARRRYSMRNVAAGGWRRRGVRSKLSGGQGRKSSP